MFIKSFRNYKSKWLSSCSHVYKKFYKLLKQSKPSKKEVYEKFYKLLKQGKARKQAIYGKFFKLLKQTKAKQASKQGFWKCLVKESFTVLRYFQKKQTFYKAYTH